MTLHTTSTTTQYLREVLVTSDHTSETNNEGFFVTTGVDGKVIVNLSIENTFIRMNVLIIDSDVKIYDFEKDFHIYFEREGEDIICKLNGERCSPFIMNGHEIWDANRVVISRFRTDNSKIAALFKQQGYDLLQFTHDYGEEPWDEPQGEYQPMQGFIALNEDKVHYLPTQLLLLEKSRRGIIDRYATNYDYSLKKEENYLSKFLADFNERMKSNYFKKGHSSMVISRICLKEDIR